MKDYHEDCMRAVFTERDIPLGGELRVPPGSILTPSAQDLANARGVKIIELKTGESLPAASPSETVAIGSDHGGFEMKQKLLPMFEELHLAIHDIGVHDAKPADYPDIARQVAELVAAARQPGASSSTALESAPPWSPINFRECAQPCVMIELPHETAGNTTMPTS